MILSRPVALALIPVGLALALPASAASPPGRESNLVVYGDDPCPRPADAEADEIVVCARKPEEERYRIPPRLRERPDSCSVVGSGGQTGCTQMMIRQWFDERRLRSIQNSGVP